MKNKFRKIILLAIPYLLTTIFPILSLFCLGYMTISDYNTQILSSKQDNIESSFDRYCKRMDEVKFLSAIVAQNDTTANYIYSSMRGDPHSVSENMELRDLLEDYQISDNILTIYIYDVINNTVISSECALSNADDYFKYSYRHADGTYKDMISRLQALTGIYGFSEAFDAVYCNSNTEVVEYRLPLPVELAAPSQCQLVLVMDTERVFCDIFDIIDDSCEFYIYDYNDCLIYSNGSVYKELAAEDTFHSLKKTKFEGDTIYSMVHRSKDRNWTIKIYMPDFVSVQGLGENATITVILMIASITLSMVATIFFTLKNHRQFQDIANLFAQQGTGADTHSDSSDTHFREIRRKANNLIQENSSLRDVHVRYEKSRKYQVLDKILRNTYKSLEEMLSDIKSEHLNLQTGRQMILCIKYKPDSGKNASAMQDQIHQRIEFLYGQQFEMFEDSRCETVCILGIHDTMPSVQAIVSTLEKELSPLFPEGVTVAASNITESIYQLSGAYMQVKAVLHYREISGKPLCLYAELTGVRDVYFCPRKHEEAICNAVVTGKNEEARRILEDIYEQNFGDEAELLSVRAIEALKGRLKDVLLSIAQRYEIPVDDGILKTGEQQDVVTFFETLCDSVDALTDKIVSKKKAGQQNSAEKIMQYVNDHFCESILSVKQISVDLGLNPNYISQLFSNEYGENLSAVIERKRIERACELIKNTNMKIQVIAESVGYSTDVSFRRAFKRVTGMSPSEYRGDGTEGA